MHHRLRFLPLILILAGLALGLALEPNDAGAQAGAPAAAPAADRGGAQTLSLERRATTALRVARRARKIARRGLSQATAALAAAQEAQVSAEGAEARLDAAKVVSDTEQTGAVSTGDDTQYVSLGGPTVTATVPASGLIEVWASVRFDDPSDGLVALYEDGDPVTISGQEGLCGGGGGSSLGDVLLSAAGGPGLPVTLSTPSALFFPIGCGTPGGVPGPMLFERTPGQHVYELRYADCGCSSGPSSFSERVLRVAGRE